MAVIRKPSPVVPMQVVWFFMPEEGMAKSQQDQARVNCVFWLGRCCPSQYTSPAKYLIRSATSMFFIGWEMQYDQNGHSSGQCDWQLHHDNVPAYAPCLIQRFLAKYQITQVTQPAYNPDLAPCDFWLFLELKSPSKGKRFQGMRFSKIRWGSWWWFQQRNFAVF